MDKTKETLQSRKFWTTAIIIIAAIVLAIFNFIDLDAAVEMIRLAAAVYVGALSVEDAAKKLGPIIGDILGKDKGERL